MLIRKITLGNAVLVFMLYVSNFEGRKTQKVILNNPSILKSKTMKNLDKDITRKDAIKKMGKYAALTAAGTFLILNPKKAQATLD